MDVDASEPFVIDVPDNLPEFWRFRGGVNKMNPSHQTTYVKVHAGSHARRSRPGKVIICTGFPQSFVACSFFESMLASSAASPSAVQSVRERKCYGFNETPLSTGKIIRLDVQCISAFRVATVQLAVNAYIVPDGATAHEVILRTDRWARFHVREYKDIGKHETPNYPAPRSFFMSLFRSPPE